MRQINKALVEVFDEPTRRGVMKAFMYLFKNQPLITTTLATAAFAYFTVANAALYLVDGILVSLAGSTHWTPAGITVPNSGANIACYGFAVDKLGNQYSFGGNQTFTSVSGVQFPTPPDTLDGPLPVIYAILTNGSAGNFVPGTTNTNTASLTWQFIVEVDGIYNLNSLGQV